MKYKTSGVCAPFIEFDIDKNNRLRNVAFTGGCTGNLLAIAKLVEGMPLREAVMKLEGIQCRNGTSCPDQLAQAIRKVMS